MSKDLAELPTLTITYRGLCNFLLSDNNLQAYGDSDDSVDIPASSLMRLFPMRAVPYNELADEVMDQLKEWQDENAYRKPMPQRKDIVFVLRQMRFVSLMARLMTEKEERWRSDGEAEINEGLR